jgi:hypothetical protein
MPRKVKRTKFVPRVVLGAAATMSVVPAVALVHCGGKTTSPEFGVAAVFDGSYPATVAAGFGEAGPYPSVGAAFQDSGFPGVAAIFDSGTDAPEFTVAAIFDSGTDAPEFSVAAIFDSGTDAPGFVVAATFDSGTDDDSGDV